MQFILDFFGALILALGLLLGAAVSFGLIAAVPYIIARTLYPQFFSGNPESARRLTQVYFGTCGLVFIVWYLFYSPAFSVFFT